MPIANKYSIDELLAACRNYFDKTGAESPLNTVWWQE